MANGKRFSGPSSKKKIKVDIDGSGLKQTAADVKKIAEGWKEAAENLKEYQIVVNSISDPAKTVAFNAKNYATVYKELQYIVENGPKILSQFGYKSSSEIPEKSKLHYVIRAYEAISEIAKTPGFNTILPPKFSRDLPDVTKALFYKLAGAMRLESSEMSGGKIWNSKDSVVPQGMFWLDSSYSVGSQIKTLMEREDEFLESLKVASKRKRDTYRKMLSAYDIPEKDYARYEGIVADANDKFSDQVKAKRQVTRNMWSESLDEVGGLSNHISSLNDVDRVTMDRILVKGLDVAAKTPYVPLGNGIKNYGLYFDAFVPALAKAISSPSKLVKAFADYENYDKTQIGKFLRQGFGVETNVSGKALYADVSAYLKSNQFLTGEGNDLVGNILDYLSYNEDEFVENLVKKSLGKRYVKGSKLAKDTRNELLSWDAKELEKSGFLGEISEFIFMKTLLGSKEFNRLLQDSAKKAGLEPVALGDIFDVPGSEQKVKESAKSASKKNKEKIKNRVIEPVVEGIVEEATESIPKVSKPVKKGFETTLADKAANNQEKELSKRDALKAEIAERELRNKNLENQLAMLEKEVAEAKLKSAAGGGTETNESKIANVEKQKIDSVAKLEIANASVQGDNQVPGDEIVVKRPYTVEDIRGEIYGVSDLQGKIDRAEEMFYELESEGGGKRTKQIKELEKIISDLEEQRRREENLAKREGMKSAFENGFGRGGGRIASLMELAFGEETKAQILKTASDISVATRDYFERISEDTRIIFDRLGRSVRTLASVMYSGIHLAQALENVMSINDNMTSLIYRLQRFDKRGSSRDEIFNNLYYGARESRADMESLGTLSQRILATGVVDSSGNALRLAELFSKATILGGSSGQESRTALVQLSQALASNQLGGDELRSLRENAIGLTDMLAKGLKKGYEQGIFTNPEFADAQIGTLKQLGKKSLLTADVVTTAISLMEDEINKSFGEMPMLFSHTMNRLSNTFRRKLDEFNREGKGLGRVTEMFAKLDDWLNSRKGKRVVDALMDTFDALIEMLVKVGDFISTIMDRFSEPLSVLTKAYISWFPYISASKILFGTQIHGRAITGLLGTGGILNVAGKMSRGASIPTALGQVTDNGTYLAGSLLSPIFGIASFLGLFNPQSVKHQYGVHEYFEYLMGKPFAATKYDLALENLTKLLGDDNAEVVMSAFDRNKPVLASSLADSIKELGYLDKNNPLYESSKKTNSILDKIAGISTSAKIALGLTAAAAVAIAAKVAIDAANEKHYEDWDSYNSTTSNFVHLTANDRNERYQAMKDDVYSHVTKKSFFLDTYREGYTAENTHGYIYAQLSELNRDRWLEEIAENTKDTASNTAGTLEITDEFIKSMRDMQTRSFRGELLMGGNGGGGNWNVVIHNQSDLDNVAQQIANVFNSQLKGASEASLATRG